MPKEKTSPTMKDVAQEAGVSLGTVSKVINGIPVGKAYRIRVEKAIKTLNYRVNTYAQGMRSDRTRTIQVIIPNLTNPFFAELVNCISRDNYGGGYLAAEKLIENGCSHLAVLRSGSSLPNEPNKRKDGFASACEERGIPYTLKAINDETPYSVFEAFFREHTHGGKLDYDGIFCVTDALAHWTRSILTSMGLRIPDDVQIIGFDGVRCFGNMDFFCSTIVQPLEGIAETCVSLVLDDPPMNAPSLICLPVSYAYGGTTQR